MASQYIEIIGTDSRLGAEFRQLVDQARRLQQHAEQVQDVADQVAAGADWVALGAKLGVSAANAEVAYNLLVAFRTVINKAGYDLFVDRLG